MNWLSDKSKETLASFFSDLAKIILAGYFAGEYFDKLASP